MKEIVGGTDLPDISPIPAVLVLLVYLGWLLYLYNKRDLLRRPFMSAVFPFCFLIITMLNFCVLSFFVLGSPYIGNPPPGSLEFSWTNVVRELVGVIGGIFGVAFLVTGRRMKDWLLTVPSIERRLIQWTRG